MAERLAHRTDQQLRDDIASWRRLAAQARVERQTSIAREFEELIRDREAVLRGRQPDRPLRWDH